MDKFVSNQNRLATGGEKGYYIGTSTQLHPWHVAKYFVEDIAQKLQKKEQKELLVAPVNAIMLLLTSVNDYFESVTGKLDLSYNSIFSLSCL